jgi:hypothetical protein
MKRLLAGLLAVCLTCLCASCGNVFIDGGFQARQSSLSGTVSFVEVNTVISGGMSIEITFVTFFQNGISSSMNFCGDQSSQFPLNQTVTTNFTPGQPCATLVIVVIVG